MRYLIKGIRSIGSICFNTSVVTPEHKLMGFIKKFNFTIPELLDKSFLAYKAIDCFGNTQWLPNLNMACDYIDQVYQGKRKCGFFWEWSATSLLVKGICDDSRYAEFVHKTLAVVESPQIELKYLPIFTNQGNSVFVYIYDSNNPWVRPWTEFLFPCRLESSTSS